MRRVLCVALMALLIGGSSVKAEFLFTPGARTTPNGFYEPTLTYNEIYYEYSAWDIFYAPHSLANYPDIFAPYGGLPGSAPNTWRPEQLSAANSNPNNQGAGTFPSGFGVYNPSNPFAFWDTRNPTITQTSANTAFIVGPDISGNIYTFQQKTSYMLANNPDYTQLGTVIFQFQTDGTAVDFSSIRLVWNDGTQDHTIYATDAEYLREYRSSGSGHWSASAGYSNRVALQWDMTDAWDIFGNPVTEYKIYWESQSSSMSFQKADLVTSDTYEAGIPISATWVGGAGNWTQSANWELNPNSALTLPQSNGNIRFANSGAATLTLNDAHHSVGEVIFQSAQNVTINSLSGYRITSNTGVTTRESATGSYTINSNFAFGALNFFEINAGTVNMNGVISGSYGMVKSGDGTLVLGNNNTFTEFIGVQGGTLVLNGTNAYTGSTSVVYGRLELGANAGNTGALGNSSDAIALGADAGLFEYVGAGQSLLAELMLNGTRSMSRDILLAAGNFEKRLGGMNASGGATFSGEIVFGTASANPDSTDAAAGEVYLTATAAGDVVRFAGEMTGGHTSKKVYIDGEGTVVYSGVNKTYQNATVVQKGRLVLEQGTSMTGAGAVTVNAGATFVVNGNLGSGGALSVSGVLSGSGTVHRGLSLTNGGTLSPGNSVGTLTITQNVVFGQSGRYLWELQDVDSGSGTGWDMLLIDGSLTVDATSENRFVLQVASLNALGQDGNVADFSGASLYDWTILTATGGILGFSNDKFEFNLTELGNTNSGNFSLQRVVNGNGSESLVLHYDPVAVPEPSRAMLLLTALCIAATRRRRKLPVNHS